MPYLAFQPDALSDVQILPIADVETSYYLRVRVKDQVGVLADIARILADAGISIDAMLQKGPGDDENETDIVILTHPHPRSGTSTPRSRAWCSSRRCGRTTPASAEKTWSDDFG